MAEDWAINVKKYAPDADDAVIAAIVRYCGIALRNRDSSLVSFSDPAETARVRQNYCRKKLALTEPDAEVDAAIGRVGEQMRDDRTRNRVTVYYLLADAFGKLGMFGGSGAAKAPIAAMAAGATGAAGAAAAIPLATATAADSGAPALRQARPVAAATYDRPDGYVGLALGVLGGLAVIIIGTATLGSQIGSRASSAPAAAVAPATFAAPVATAPATVAAAIPAGAGVVAQEVAGKPLVSVYFDTAKTAIAPDFAAAVAPVNAWLDGHPGDRLTVSGFNDSRGNAAFNAELSKNRAKAVGAALTAAGVPAAAIDLVKPADTTDTATTMENARRVDIVVKDGG